MKIYEVLLIYSCIDDDGFETHHFTNFNAALDKFNEIKKDELLSGTSWVCEAFDENSGKLNEEDYELFSNTDDIRGEQELYWSLFCYNNKNTYFQLYLKIIGLPTTDGIENIVNYKGETYKFRECTEAYVFNFAILNNMDTRYDMKTVFDYIELVTSCYLKDDNPTPLGSLADFIAEHWEEVKGLSRLDILDRFYTEVC